ncbi:hypothetical protein [Granulicatella adiacens]|uniref:hypothetical protein n=1 Tax=Granulicatella adiacens TaxID=46124 RepID=UPI001C3DB36C|nr:hypothetical protein [Granulicatella adiacens]
MENLIELKKQRAELDRKIYMLECTECPLKEGDEFWYVDQFGNIEHRIFGNHEWIKQAMSQGHIFYSEQEARLESKRRDLLNRVKIFRDKCNNNWKPNWEDYNEEKHYMCYTKDNHLACYHDKETNNFPLFGYFQKWVDVFDAIELFKNEIEALFINCEV